MNPLSKQDMQAALQQATNIILTRTASHQDVSDVVQNLSQKLMCKQDLQNAVDRVKDRFNERVLPVLHDQHIALKQLVANLEAINHRLARLEERLETAQASLKTVQSETELVMNRTRLNPLMAGVGMQEQTASV